MYDEKEKEKEKEMIMKKAVHQEKADILWT